MTGWHACAGDPPSCALSMSYCTWGNQKRNKAVGYRIAIKFHFTCHNIDFHKEWKEFISFWPHARRKLGPVVHKVKLLYHDRKWEAPKTDQVICTGAAATPQIHTEWTCWLLKLVFHQTNCINPFFCLSHSLSPSSVIIPHQPLKLKFQNWINFLFCIVLNKYGRYIQLSHA